MKQQAKQSGSGSFWLLARLRKPQLLVYFVIYRLIWGNMDDTLLNFGASIHKIFHSYGKN